MTQQSYTKEEKYRGLVNNLSVINKYPWHLQFHKSIKGNGHLWLSSKTGILTWCIPTCIKQQISKLFGWIDHKSCKRIIQEKKKPLLHKFVCFQMPYNKASGLKPLNISIFEWEITSFSKTMTLFEPTALALDSAQASLASRLFLTICACFAFMLITVLCNCQ